MVSPAEIIKLAKPTFSVDPASLDLTRPEGVVLIQPLEKLGFDYDRLSPNEKAEAQKAWVLLCNTICHNCQFSARHYKEAVRLAEPGCGLLCAGMSLRMPAVMPSGTTTNGRIIKGQIHPCPGRDSLKRAVFFYEEFNTFSSNPGTILEKTFAKAPCHAKPQNPNS